MTMFTTEIVDGPHRTRDSDDWLHDAYRLRCRYGPQSFVIPWRQGVGIEHDPDPRSVLECLLSDASSADQPFEDWCGDYGYDPDSRKAYATWQQVTKQTRELKRIFGEDWPTVERTMQQTDTEAAARRFADAA